MMFPLAITRWSRFEQFAAMLGQSDTLTQCQRSRDNFRLKIRDQFRQSCNKSKPHHGNLIAPGLYERASCTFQFIYVAHCR